VDVKWDRCVYPPKEQKQVLDLTLLSQVVGAGLSWRPRKYH
jgi:hypothetical protein